MNRRSRRLVLTTNTKLKAVAAQAIIELSNPSAANGTAEWRRRQSPGAAANDAASVFVSTFSPASVGSACARISQRVGMAK